MSTTTNQVVNLKAEFKRYLNVYFESHFLKIYNLNKSLLEVSERNAALSNDVTVCFLNLARKSHMATSCCRAAVLGILGFFPFF